MLSEETKSQLEKDDNLKFATYFINLGNDKTEIRNREISIEIASIWCRLHEVGQEGRNLPDELAPNLSKLLQTELNDRFEKIEEIWSEMCANAALYEFARIDEFTFTKALYGIFRILLPPDQDIEPQDETILKSVIQAHNVNVMTTKEFGIAIKTDGLSSKAIIVPQGANSWTDYGDQYMIFLSVD